MLSLVTDRRSNPPPYWPYPSQDNASPPTSEPTLPTHSVAAKSEPEAATAAADTSSWGVEPDMDEAARWGYTPTTPSSPPSPPPPPPQPRPQPISRTASTVVSASPISPNTSTSGAELHARTVARTSAELSHRSGSDDAVDDGRRTPSDQRLVHSMPPAPTSPPLRPASTIASPSVEVLNDPTARYTPTKPRPFALTQTETQGPPPHLNAHAQAFTPGSRPTTSTISSPLPAPVTLVPPHAAAPVGDVDLNDYITSIKQNASLCASPSPTPTPAGSTTPLRPSERSNQNEEGNNMLSEEEDMATQWRHQAVWHKGLEMDVSEESSMRISIVDGDGLGMRIGKEGRSRKHTVANVKSGNNVRAPAKSTTSSVLVSTLTPFGLALARARKIEDIARVDYPEGIIRPDASLLAPADVPKSDVLRYDREFLLQFQSVCRARPGSFPSVDTVWLHVLPASSSHHFPVDLAARMREIRASSSGTSATVDDYEATVELSHSRQRLARGDLDNVDQSPTIPSSPARWCNSPTSTVVGGVSLLLGSSHAAMRREESSLCGHVGSPSFDEEILQARLDRLEKRVALLVSEIEVVRLELARLRSSS
ncbi:hypothetical protein C8Q74DRAFT_933042 [Fomes fomentarius]|nr:hypothetical protein C8Q74DRAFT_933042 [Fomes fomentarius]